MTPSEILNAIGQRLMTMPSCPPTVWPNKKPPILPDKPYLVFANVARSDRDDAISGGAGYSTGRTQITVVWELNDYSTGADNLASQIKAYFPVATQMGRLRITRSQVMDGYPDDVSWRVPVILNWIAT